MNTDAIELHCENCTSGLDIVSYISVYKHVHGKLQVVQKVIMKKHRSAPRHANLKPHFLRIGGTRRVRISLFVSVVFDECFRENIVIFFIRLNRTWNDWRKIFSIFTWRDHHYKNNMLFLNWKNPKYLVDMNIILFNELSFKIKYFSSFHFPMLENG